MKLECPVIRDLYNPYVKKEVSGEVSEAVEEHLEYCEQCKHLYGNGRISEVILKKDQDEQPSIKNDKEMILRLRLKISRLKKALLLIATILLILLYSNYTQSRYNLLYDLSPAEQTLRNIYFTADDIKNDYANMIGFTSDINDLDLDNQNSIILRDLNLIEKYELKKVPNGLFMNFEVNNLYNLLKTRHINGTFTTRDEKAASLLKQYMNDITKIFTDVRLSLNKLYGSGKLIALILPINIKGIAEDYDKINQLALLYTQYDKIPGELTRMSETNIKARLKSIFDFDDLNITFTPNIKDSIRFNGACNFNIKQGSVYYNGEIDAYNGNIKSLNSNSYNTKGKLQNLGVVKSKLKKLLERMYGKEQSFHIKYAGINYHFSSNEDIKLYSFKVSPTIKGLKVNSEFLIYMDARTGNLNGILGISGHDFIVPNYDIDTIPRISPKDGLEKLNISQKEDYSYSETIIIKSMLSGKYVPVYVYKYETNTVYVNTITGKQEFVY